MVPGWPARLLDGHDDWAELMVLSLGRPAKAAAAGPIARMQWDPPCFAVMKSYVGTPLTCCSWFLIPNPVPMHVHRTWIDRVEVETAGNTSCESGILVN